MDCFERIVNSKLLEGIVDLPEELRNRKVKVKITLYEDEIDKYYNSLSSLGKEAYDKGVQEGMRETLAESIIKLLSDELGELPENYKDKIDSLDILILEDLRTNLYNLKKLEDIDKYII